MAGHSATVAAVVPKRTKSVYIPFFPARQVFFLQREGDGQKKYKATHRLQEHFPCESFYVAHYTVCRFAVKTRFFRSRWAGRHCVAASRFLFSKLKRFQKSGHTQNVCPLRKNSLSDVMPHGIYRPGRWPVCLSIRECGVRRKRLRAFSV